VVTRMDFRYILLVVLIIINVILWTRLYLYYRKTSKKIEKPQQKLNTTEQIEEEQIIQQQQEIYRELERERENLVKLEMKKALIEEERSQEFVEVRDKVDRLIAEKYEL
jgi:hypothetical protein